MRTGRIHFARIDHSPRLQRMLAFLRERGREGATGLEIARGCDVLNPATYCSELRSNGIAVECRYERATDSGQRVFRYFLGEHV